MAGLLQRTVKRRAATSPTGPGGLEPEFDGGDGPAADVRPRERARIRRRLRHLRRLRELQLRDLGGLVFDLYRFGEQRDDLVREKLERVAQTDREARDLEILAGRREPHHDVRQPGVGGACPECGELYPSDARFCAHCGILLVGDIGRVAEVTEATGEEPQEQGTLFYAQATEEQAAIVPAPEEPEAGADDDQITTWLPAVETDDADS